MLVTPLESAFSTLITQRLEKLLQKPNLPQCSLFEAARYSLLGPGKRLRPILLLSILHAYKLPIEYGLDIACSLEMIHTYSLIHDDLPCMDDDDLRRGRPTLHKAYSEAEAVLAGDFLLTYAFQVVADSPLLTAEQKIKAIHTLSIRAGALGMIGGQYIDIASEGKQISWDTLEYMHLHKTAALFTAAFELGGIIASVSKHDSDLLQECGQTFGIAYQVLDDIVDAAFPEKSSDISNTKATIVSMLGMQHAEKKAKWLFEETLKIASQLTIHLSFFEELIHKLLQQLTSMKSHK